MLFSSMVFLWVFLPIVIIANYLFNFTIKDNNKRMKTKNIFLLVASLIFYAWGGVYFLSIMIFSIAINFTGGYIISKLNAKKKVLKKRFLLI